MLFLTGMNICNIYFWTYAQTKLEGTYGILTFFGTSDPPTPTLDQMRILTSKCRRIEKKREKFGPKVPKYLWDFHNFQRRTSNPPEFSIYHFHFPFYIFPISTFHSSFSIF